MVCSPAAMPWRNHRSCALCGTVQTRYLRKLSNEEPSHSLRSAQTCSRLRMAPIKPTHIVEPLVGRSNDVQNDFRNIRRDLCNPGRRLCASYSNSLQLSWMPPM